jgi:dipeptidase
MFASKFAKKAAVLAIGAAVVLGCTLQSFACTSVYFGKGTTENGSVIWGRSEDISASYGKQVMIHEAEDHEEGEEYVSSTGFKWPYPARTYRYILAKDSYYNDLESPEPYAEAGMNEKNVAISATVTLSGGKVAIAGATRPTRVEGLDESVSTGNGGLAETDLTTVVLMNAASAKEACELVGEIVTKVGSAGREGFMVSDPTEVWYMQLLSGHQYIAVKCPDDQIGFSPNMTGNVPLIEGSYIASPGLLDIANRAGTLVAADGKIKIADSYAAPSTSVNARLWLGEYYNKGLEAAEALTPGYIDYFTDPGAEKYSLYHALRILAFRGEGTSKDAGSAGGNGTAIGNDGTIEAHLFETRDNMPAELATIEWLCVAPPEFGVYLPFYGSLVDSVIDEYYLPDSGAKANPAGLIGYDRTDPDNNSVYWVFRELYTQSKGSGTRADRTRYGAGVQAFWETFQKDLIAKQPEIDALMVDILEQGPEYAQRAATAISKELSSLTYGYAKRLVAELAAFKAAGTEGDFVPSFTGELADFNYGGLTEEAYAKPILYEAGGERYADIIVKSGKASLLAPSYDADGKLVGVSVKADVGADSDPIVTVKLDGEKETFYFWDENYAPIRAAIDIG